MLVGRTLAEASGRVKGHLVDASFGASDRRRLVYMNPKSSFYAIFADQLGLF